MRPFFGKAHEAFEPRLHEVKMELRMHFMLLFGSVLLQFVLIIWRLWDSMPEAEFFGLVNLILVKLAFWLDWLSFFDFTLPIWDPARGAWLKVPFYPLPYRADLLALTEISGIAALGL